MKETEEKPEDHGEVVKRSSARRRLSWAWLFPLLAALAAGWLFWKHWKSNGPEIEIRFKSAPGIQAGKTLLIYRGVNSGTVTDVSLDKLLDAVIVKVRLKAFATDLACRDTAFWIDQPVISLEQTTGLDSIVQGNSIRATKGDGPPTFSFVGLDKQPLTPLEEPSLIVSLQARDIPFLSRGTPVYFRGVPAGLVEDKIINDKGVPTLRVVINKEFEKIVQKNSRFWVLAGTSLTMGAGGVKLDVAGLAALLRGGVAFDTFEPATGEVLDEQIFELFPSENAAKAVSPPVRIAFDDGRGLEPGDTEICFLGLPVGLVEKVIIQPETSRVEVVARFHPGYDFLRREGSVFTLVRPKISLQGVSGLDTIVSGPYIAAVPGTDGPTVEDFIGRTVSDEEWDRAKAEGEGLTIALHAKNIPTLAKNTPILYRGVQVGRILEKTVGEGDQAILHAVIQRDQQSLVRANARFWRVPATAVEAGPGVLKVEVNGLASLIQGAVEFDTFGQPGQAAVDGASFELFGSKVMAQAISAPVTITFENGQGLRAGLTQLRYLGVPVGVVDQVLTGRGRVRAVVRFNEGYDFLRRRGAAFALVRPKISLDGVSGLETLVSGVYIECQPGSAEADFASEFSGSSFMTLQEQAPRRGLAIVVTTSSSSIGVGAPIYYRGMQVGKVTGKSLDRDGRSVDLAVEIEPAYEELVRVDSKFWDVSGVEAKLGFIWLKVQTASLDAVVRGGIAFASPDTPEIGPRAKRGQQFELFPSPRREWLKWAPAIPIGEK